MRSPVKTLLAAVAVAVLAAPAATQGASKSPRAELNRLQGHEREYLDVRERFVDRFGLRAAGRDIVRLGFLEKGEVRHARKPEVVESTEYMKGRLNPPAATETEVVTGEAEAAYGSGGAAASSSTAQCESGGDYGAVNPAGYYGAYQFDQSTWDAYAPEGYQGTNPAEAPPAVQDAAAANVDYDAWPSC